MVLCALILLYGVVSSVVFAVRQKWIDPANPEDTSEITFVIKSGDSLNRVSNNLEKQNLVKSGTFFKYFADFKGFGQKIQAGEYTLKRSMTINEILDRLSSGDGKPTVMDITVIPGWTVEDVANYLVKRNALKDGQRFLSLCRDGKNFSEYYYIYDVLNSPDAQNRKYALEGYLAPDTYEIYISSDEETILRKLISQTEAVFPSEFQERAKEINLSMDEVFTLASLIEKEAKTQDFARVSAVFHNRLRKNMTLGSDAAVKYVLGTNRMALSDEDISVQSYYNTYKYKGLPPGPICNPSQDAVRAALYPDEEFLNSNMLYFCSTNPDTGELHFSRTLEEHEQAVKIYRPLWQAFDEKRANTQN